MNSKSLRLTVALIFAVVALAASQPAQAGTKKFVLSPVDPGMKMEGIAALSTRGKIEQFTVRVFADLPDVPGPSADRIDGLVVAIVKNGEKIDVAKLFIELGSGIVTLDNRMHVSPVFPVAEIEEVLVFKGTKLLLRGYAYAR
jgi:hypothetical protein